MPEQSKKAEPASALELSRDDLHVHVEPEAGGAISRFRCGNWDVLRPSPPGASPLEAASYVLAPYANRIRSAAFVFQGRKIELDFADVDHALHGYGWQASWNVVEANGSRAVLAYRHEPGAWPWAYVCKQVIELGERSLRMELSVRNLDRSPMPAGLGFHPRFQSSAGARLTARVGGYWEVDDELLPIGRREDVQRGDWTRGDAVARARTVDNCFWDWDGRAVLDFPARNARVEILASPSARMLQLYLPVDPKAGFCVEPVTHAPDAFNNPEPYEATGLTVLEPGATLEASMELRFSALDGG